ncbi:CapA family protein [Cohnella zeiphila]|uniref:CapA family protein n=1 Tax=Cohnella zeiphila TaxID=2761120 RepID=A0A7X0SUC2_9BACL|nr:CapA family protein [Cohnella zeiphila]MBB6735060.1 CapA family protein [Cohnella zeiphila]
MSYSRTRSRREARQKMRRLLYVNVTMLAVVLLIGGLLAYRWLHGGGSEMLSGLFRPAPSHHSAAPPTDGPNPAADSALPDGSGAENGGTLPDGDGSEDGGGLSLPDGSPAPQDGGGSANEATLAFVGDLLPASKVGDLMDKNGVDYPFAKAMDTLRSADLTAGNLETPLTNRGTPAENKQYVFRGKPEYAAGIKDAGFDVLTLANNHTLDQGWEGLQDTMDALNEQGLQHVGSGVDDTEAFTPAYLEAGGIRFAFIGVSNVVPEVGWKADKNHPGVAETYDTTRAVAAIRDAKKLADVVVVMVHWGKERSQEPIPVQVSVGHTFIDAGADLIIGSHPHVLQGFEYYKKRWIAYSLGNFVFTTNGDSVTQQTGVLKARCAKDGQCGLTFEPMYSSNSQPAPMDAEEGRQLLASLSSLSIGARIGEDGSITPLAESGEETP